MTESHLTDVNASIPDAAPTARRKTPMDARTLTALQGSIAKWEAIVAGTGVDDGAENCPLCELFRLRTPATADCDGCPVSAATGLPYCRDTPYRLWTRAATVDGDSFFDEESKILARAELAFLQSLLP